MKKLFLLLFVFSSFYKAEAQTSISSDSICWRYADIFGTNGGLFSNPKVEIYFGEELGNWAKTPEEALDPKTGKPIRFSTMIDAMNFMSIHGWDFVQSWNEEIGEFRTYHYIIRKKALRKK